MAFDFGLWSDGVSPLLFVCEEAHRYAPADSKIGFGPTRRALSRIAKEGRKYGVFLGLVTQRPAEIDSTIISQCTTLFVMRLSNDRDQALIRSAVSDAGANLLSFIPSLGTGEVFAFGAGVALPTRMNFKRAAAGRCGRSSEAGGNTRAAAGHRAGSRSDRVGHRPLARATMSHKAMRRRRSTADFGSPLDSGDCAPMRRACSRDATVVSGTGADPRPLRPDTPPTAAPGYELTAAERPAQAVARAHGRAGRHAAAWLSDDAAR